MNPTTPDLFADAEPVQQPRREQIGEQSYVLRGFALPWLERLLPALEAVLAAAPFRQMVTPGGIYHVGRPEQLWRLGLDH